MRAYVTIVFSASALALCAASFMGCSKILGLDGLVADRDAQATSGTQSSGTQSTGAQTTGAGAAGSTGSNTGSSTGSSTGSGCASTCGTPGCGACPTPTLISAGSYTIDSEEVTTAQYAAWLATNPSTAGQGPRCMWNDSFEPGVISQAALDAAVAAGIDPGPNCDNWLANLTPLEQMRPIACIDWCDATAYCLWAGEHLCGKIGGGTIDITPPHQADANDPAKSEWYSACSMGGARIYPYGPTFVMDNCNDDNSHGKDVGSYPMCEGGYTGLFDMSGNVNEWEDACTNFGNPPASENCLRRGGAYYGPSNELPCTLPSLELTGTLPGLPSDGTGIRCCK